MLRNYIASALGNLARNWLYAGVTISGLAVGFAAAILVGLFIRDDYSYDRWLPDYQRIFRLDTSLTLPGDKPRHGSQTLSDAAAFLKFDFPQVDAVARFTSWAGGVRRGRVETTEHIMWTDPQLFSILRLPVLAGDLRSALGRPDSIVITRTMARKYFGKDAPIGETLEVNTSATGPSDLQPAEAAALAGWHQMRVTAVLRDLPSNTHLSAEIFAAGGAPFSMLRMIDAHPSPFSASVYAYVRLKANASADAVRQGLRAFADRRYPGPNGARAVWSFHLRPIADIHLARDLFLGPSDSAPGNSTVDAGMAAIGILVVLVAAINFVTLMTARSGRRAVEIGIRKVAGAQQANLVIQFVSEALIYVLLAMLLAASLAELSLPFANAFLQRTMRLDYLHDWELDAALLMLGLAVGLLAGAYPALVLSSFRPALVLRGGPAKAAGSGMVRHVLVVVQFAILIGLTVATSVIYRQTIFALHDRLRADTDQVLSIEAPCDAAFSQEIAAAPGVKAASCASGMALGVGMNMTTVVVPGGRSPTAQAGVVGPGFFELQGLKPLAGRFFSLARGADAVLTDPAHPADASPTVVLNQTAVRRFGFKSPQAAIGQTIRWTRWNNGGPGGLGYQPPRPSQIVGVTPDYTLGSIRNAIDPSIYYVDPKMAGFVVIKLDGRHLPEALGAIRKVWDRTGHDQPMQFTFEAQQLMLFHRDLLAQGVVIGSCAGLAVFIACLGLYALAAFTTEQRTKEIGVRKAMGASTIDVVRLLLWQFTQPVLWANLIAWPLAWWAMDHWLHGFAYRVDLPAWLFVAASATAVLIAWLTVSIHAWLVARARPVLALRYE